MGLENTKSFGSLTAEDFSVGELVFWGDWDPENYEFKRIYGIILDIFEKEYNGRMVSMANVASLAPANIESTIFIMHLNKTNTEKEVKNVNC